MTDFSHLDEKGRVKMVNVSGKPATERLAVARGFVSMKPETLQAILNQETAKGAVLETARIAGVMAAKKTWDLIPMCHPLELTHAEILFNPDPDNSCIHIEASARTTGRTGVEMEALTAVSIAALAIYDMCKAVDKGMVISDIHLARKSGGKSGEYVRKED